MTEVQRKQTQRKNLGCVGVILIILAVIYLFRGCDGSSSDISGAEAEIIAKDFVKTSLKAPSTADFSNSSSRDLGDKTFIVSGNVDAQNSFGAMLRNTYQVKLKYNGGEWTDSNNWTLLDIKLY